MQKSRLEFAINQFWGGDSTRALSQYDGGEDTVNGLGMNDMYLVNCNNGQTKFTGKYYGVVEGYFTI